MIFLIDFISQGLSQGLDTGWEYWVLFGLGAIVGPLLSGQLADRAGFAPAVCLAFLIEAFAVALPASSSNPVWLCYRWAFTPGIVPLVLGRVHEL